MITTSTETNSVSHGTQEWAASNVNIQDGCEHDCRYVTDSIWLGKANRLRQIIPFNCPGDATALRRAEELIVIQSDDNIRALYHRHRKDPLIKWKDSIKQVIGLHRPNKAGLDV